MELTAVMLVGAAVGRAGCHLFRRSLPGDGVIAACIGIVGALLTAVLAHRAGASLDAGALMLASAVGAMVFFSLVCATSPRDGDDDGMSRRGPSGGGAGISAGRA